jgi:hypothetical protein
MERDLKKQSFCPRPHLAGNSNWNARANSEQQLKLARSIQLHRKANCSVISIKLPSAVIRDCIPSSEVESAKNRLTCKRAGPRVLFRAP